MKRKPASRRKRAAVKRRELSEEEWERLVAPKLETSRELTPEEWADIQAAQAEAERQRTIIREALSSPITELRKLRKAMLGIGKRAPVNSPQPSVESEEPSRAIDRAKVVILYLWPTKAQLPTMLAAIHREVKAECIKRGWKAPSIDRLADALGELGYRFKRRGR